MKKKIISFIIFLLLFPALRFAEETGDVANSNADNSTQSTPQTNDNTLKLIPNPKLTIQIGIFSSGERVLNIINELKKNEISCRFQERKKFFYVYCGDFDRKREVKTARVLKNKIVSLGYRDAFIAFSNEIPRYSKPEILPKKKKPVDKKPLPEPSEEPPVKHPESVAEEKPTQPPLLPPASSFVPARKFLIIISFVIFFITIMSFLVVIFLRRIGIKKSFKVDKLTRKHKDVLNLLSGENITSSDEIIKRLNTIGDDILIEVLLEKAETIFKKPASHFIHFYDATGITGRYLDILKNSKSWKKRAFAAKKLGQIGSAKSVPLLLSVIRDIKDEDEGVRGTALRALGRIRDKRAIPFLIEALGYPETWLPPRIGEILLSIGEESVDYLIKELKNYQSENRRQWAAEILGYLKAKTATMQLIGALFDISPEVRAKAAGALGQMQDDRAVVKLTELLISDPVPFVRVRVSKALGSIGHPAVIDYLINILKDPEWWVRVRAVESLEQLGEKAVPGLLIALEDDDPEVRKRSAMALDRIGYVEKIIKEYGKGAYKADLRKILFLVARAGVIQSISEALVTSEGDLKKRMVRLLGEAETKEASGPLLELLTHTSEWKLKSRIIESLARIGAKEAIPYLIENLKDNEHWLRRSTVEALGILNATDYADEIVKILEDPNPLARESALKALSGLKITEHSRKIENLLLDPSSKVRSVALQVMRELDLSIDKGKIEKILTDTSEDVRIETVRYFSENIDSSVFSNIIRFLPKGSAGLRKDIVEYVKKVKPAKFQTIINFFNMKNISKEVLASLMEIASVIQDEDSYQFVFSYTESSDEFFREKAFYELVKFGFEENEAIFEKALFDPSKEVRINVLGGIGYNSGKNLLEKAKELSGDPNENVRLALVLAFGASGFSEFRPLIIEMLDDPALKVVAGAFISLALYDDPLVLKRFYAKGNIKEIKEEITNITQDLRFSSIVETIRSRAQKLSILEVDLLLAKDEKGFASDLIKKLKEALDPEIRIKAIDLLKIIATGEFFTSILGVMKKDPSAEVRIRAMETVTSIGREDEVTSALSSMLVDPAPRVRIKAAQLIGKYKNPGALGALLHTMDTSDKQFREAVTSSLSELLRGEPEKISELVKSVPETKTRKLGMAWLMGKTRKRGALTFLVDLLTDNDADVRSSAIGALGKFKNKQLLGTFEKLIYDTNERVRAATVNAISVIDDNRTFEILKTALEDVDQYVRKRAAIGLARIDSKKAVDILKEKSTKFLEMDLYIKGILFASGHTYDKTVYEDEDSKSIVEELCPEKEMFNNFRASSDKNIRLHAFRVLNLFKREDIPDLLAIARKDPSPEIREEAEKHVSR